MLLNMSTEKKKDTCVGQKEKNGKRKGEKKKKDEKEEEREMILGEEHWNRWQERNKTPFVSFPDSVKRFWISRVSEKLDLKKAAQNSSQET